MRAVQIRWKFAVPAACIALLVLYVTFDSALGKTWKI